MPDIEELVEVSFIASDLHAHAYRVRDKDDRRIAATQGASIVKMSKIEYDRYLAALAMCTWFEDKVINKIKTSTKEIDHDRDRV